MIWRPHTEQPTRLPITAVIALHDEEVGYFVRGIYMRTPHRPDVWVDEATEKPLPEAEYWWIPEEEVLSPLGARK